jgi:peptidoglycan/xylan/chitin deacetylase (PgdA/CDA1 family)
MDALLMTLAATTVAAGLCLAPMAARRFSERRLARACAARRLLVLTFDDGPGATTTPRLLDLLAAHGARASFFVLGRKAEEHAAVLDRARRDGHEIGAHSYGHVHPWRSPPWSAAADVGAGFRSLARWVPADGLYRPPHGKLTPFNWAAAKARGARFAWWTLDSGDTWERLPEMDATIERLRAAGGGVVLLHDFEREAVRADWTLEVTRRLLETAKSDGLRVVTLGDLMNGAA